MSRSKLTPPAPSPEFSAADLLAALTGTSDVVPQAQGLTVIEIADKVGMSTKRVQFHLGRLARQGRLRVTRAPRMAIDGTIRPVPVYTITDAA